MPSANFTFTRDATKDLKWDEATSSYIAALPECTLTITPTPSDADVVLTASGFTQSGNSITVEEGTEVTYTVSKSGYITKSGTVAPTSDTIITVALEEITLDPIDESTTVKELEVNSTVYDIVGKGIIDQNSKKTQTEWVGTKAEYDALGVYANYCTYIITDDSADSQSDEVGAIAEEVNTLKGYDYVVDWQVPTAGNNYTWYRKYKSGWVEQGGITTFAQHGANTSRDNTVSLPVEMADTQYYVAAPTFITDAGNSQGLRNFRNVRSVTTLKIGMYTINALSNSYNVQWCVSGYAA